MAIPKTAPPRSKGLQPAALENGTIGSSGLGAADAFDSAKSAQEAQALVGGALNPSRGKPSRWSYRRSCEMRPKTGTQRFVQWLGDALGIGRGKGHDYRANDNKNAGYLPGAGKVVTDWSVDKAVRARRGPSGFYVRTEKPNLLHHAITEVAVLDQRGASFDYAVESFRDLATDMGVVAMECAGNDGYSGFELVSAAQWSGVRFEDLREQLLAQGIDPSLTHVRIEGFDKTDRKNWERPFGAVESTPGASWIFSIDELVRLGAFFATEMNGEPLKADHGEHLRLVVPGMFGCASIKWVNRIEFFTPTAKTQTDDQMREFADRTQKDGPLLNPGLDKDDYTPPLLYRDHEPATVELSGVPVRVDEFMDAEGKRHYRAVGLLWGGVEVETPELELRIANKGGSELVRVPVQLGPRNPKGFQAWQAEWSAEEAGNRRGRHQVGLRNAGARVSTARLDMGYYDMSVRLR